jgi:hypothetical protein
VMAEKTMCDNCSKIFDFEDQFACNGCSCVICPQCVEENHLVTCDECLKEGGGE